MMNMLTALALVLLAFGGYLNSTYATLGGPANLILIGIGLCVVLLAPRVVTLRAKVAPLLPLLLIAVACGYGVATADSLSLYGGNKVQLLLTLTPLTFVAGAWLADGERRREWLAWGIVGWGLAAVLVQRFSPDQTLSEIGRLGGEDLSYQALSRAAAAAALVLAVVAMSRRFRDIWRLLAFAGAIAFAAVAVGGGSRGPLIGLLIAVAAVAIRTRAGAVLVVLAGLAAWFLLPTVVLPILPDRLNSFDDGSTLVRADAAALAIDHIRDNPLGTGFGSLESVVAPAGPRALFYPHNVVLEIAGEAGVLAATILLGVVAVVLYRLWRRGIAFSDNATLALLTYFFVNALVSGDINSNRGLWLFLGVGSAIVFVGRKHSVEETPETPRKFASALNLASGRWRESAIGVS